MIDKGESRTDLGLIKIHKNVIASISALAAAEVDGVKGIDKDLKSAFLEWIGCKKASAIGVDIDKSSQVVLNIPLVIKYGYNIPEVSSKVQENVRSSLEKMTNVSALDINISVRSIEK
ncbi:MAG: Asp23/Gls24 family envelope stress response protein [Candidatus Omnitrophica bacterium]|nr:Asp23/Gls24 family envelope stress response protein [Candidatus Omnitrophota bacterium]